MMGLLPIRQSKRETNGTSRPAQGASLGKADRSLCIGRNTMLRWFSNLKIAHKLTLGFGLVLLLMLGTLATDAVVSTTQKAVADHLVDHLYPARQAAREVVTLARAADSDAGRYLLELDDQSRAATDLRTYEQEVQQIHKEWSRWPKR